MYMKVKFSKEALEHLSVLQELDISVTGFMTGIKMGKYSIVKNMMPIHLNEENVDEIYRKVYHKTRYSLLGVFFINTAPISSDWFAGDIILKIIDSEREISFCDFDEEMKTVNRGFENGYETGLHSF